MELSISTYRDSREGDYACSLVLAQKGRSLVAAATRLLSPGQILAFARLLATFDDSSSETASLEIEDDGWPGNGTTVRLAVWRGESAGIAELCVTEDTRHGTSYHQGPLVLVVSEESSSYLFSIRMTEVNRMGLDLLHALNEEVFQFDFDFDSLAPAPRTPVGNTVEVARNLSYGDASSHCKDDTSLTMRRSEVGEGFSVWGGQSVDATETIVGATAVPSHDVERAYSDPPF